MYPEIACDMIRCIGQPALFQINRNDVEFHFAKGDRAENGNGPPVLERGGITPDPRAYT